MNLFRKSFVYLSLLASLGVVACGGIVDVREDLKKSGPERVRVIAGKAEKAALTVLPDIEPIFSQLGLKGSSARNYVSTYLRVSTEDLDTLFTEYTWHCTEHDISVMNKSINWLSESVDLLSEMLPKFYNTTQTSGLKDIYLAAFVSSLNGIDANGLKADLLGLLTLATKGNKDAIQTAFSAFQLKYAKEINALVGTSKSLNPNRVAFLTREFTKIVKGYEQRLKNLESQMNNLSKEHYSPNCKAVTDAATARVFAKLGVEFAKI